MHAEAPPYHELAPRAQLGPLRMDGLIEGSGPLELDIGFGRGMSLFRRAMAAPQSRILGIEVKYKWAYKVEQRRKTLGLDRVRVLSEDAVELLGRAGPPGSVTRAFFHFPDPWWKKRHNKRLVLCSEMWDALARLIPVGGEVFIQTDVPHRAEEYLATIRQRPDFEVFEPNGYLEHNPFGVLSNREQRAETDGLPIYRILAKSIGSRG